MKATTTLTLAIAVLLAAGIMDARADNYENDNLRADNNPAMTSTGTVISPDKNIYPGGRSRNGITENPIDSLNAKSSADNLMQVRRLSETGELPANAQVYFMGEVVNVDPNSNQVAIRNSDGETGFYILKDRSALNNLRLGDQVEIFR